MTPILDFYFDFSSPYGYLASETIETIAQRHGRGVVWRPVLLGVMFKTTGAAPLAHIPLKGEYSMHDMARSARYFGVRYRRPSVFPAATQIAARAFYTLSELDPDLAKEFAHRCYRAYFVDDRDISQQDAVIDIAKGLSVDETRLVEAINQPQAKERLRRETEAAMQRGVFGSPYFIVDGEPFWGVDRLPQLEKWLAGGPF